MATEKTNSSGNLVENIIKLIDSRIAKIRKSIPAKITKYDVTKQIADVELLVKEKFIDPDGEEFEVDSTVLADIPVVFPASQDDVFLSFPVKAGTIGRVFFMDSALDNFINSDCSVPVSVGTDQRKHDLSFAFFEPGSRNYARPLSGLSEDDIKMRNDEISFRLVAGGKVVIQNSTAELIEELSNTLQGVIDLVNTLLSLVSNMGNQATATTVFCTALGSAVDPVVKAAAATYAAATNVTITELVSRIGELTTILSTLTTIKSKIDTFKE